MTRRNLTRYPLGDQMLTLDEAAKETKIPRKNLQWRMSYQGKTLEQAVAMGQPQMYRSNHPWRKSVDNNKPEICK